jgi:hypothetical protein
MAFLLLSLLGSRRLPKSFGPGNMAIGLVKFLGRLPTAELPSG